MSQSEIRKVGVFCGAKSGKSSLYIQAAEQLADIFCNENISLVYGGARVGIMGAIADRMLANGGEVIGVMPKSLVDVEIAHQRLTQFHTVNSMHERKALIAELSDGFMMLPGGVGSLDEFFEMFTWAQLGYHSKPCSILNVNGYYDHLLTFLDHVVSEGFMKPVFRNMVLVDQSPHKIIQRFRDYRPPAEKRVA